MHENGDQMEVSAIIARYEARDRNRDRQRYSWLNRDVHMGALENDLITLQSLSAAGFRDLSKVTLLEIGCGTGGNLLRFLRWGFDPANLKGNELLPSSLKTARRYLPPEVELLGGDAAQLDCGSFDIVYQSTVFSSILNDDFQHRLAERMWNMTAPGGGILWYDFCYDNPRNPDVRGVPIRRVQQLFPHSRMTAKRITLAPPVSRMATRVSPRFYTVLNMLPFLRTHALCWIPKD